MIRVAALADSHLNEKQDLEDNVRVHGAALNEIADAKPDLIFHAGDLHDRLSSPAVREAGLWLIDNLAQIAPVVLVRGNHDRPTDLAIYRGRRSAYRVDVFEQAGVSDFVIGPGLSRGEVRVRVQALPWIDKAQAAAQAGGSISETDDAVQRTIAKLLETMRAWALKPAEGMTLGVGHVTIGGSVLSTGQTLIGKGLELNAGDLARSGAGLWCLGHIHKKQSFVTPAAMIAYSGSIQRLSFGEPEVKGFWLWDLEHNPDAAGGVQILEGSHFVTLPARRIEREEWTLDQVRAAIAKGTLDGSQFTDARVRIRFPVRPDELAALDLDRLEGVIHAAGATQVKIEPTMIHATRVRSEEIGQVATRWGQLKAWLDTKGIDCPDEVLEERLQVKLAILEGGTS